MAAKIDYRRCIGCGTCYDLCLIDVLMQDENMAMPVVA
jgi:formate hydrogenlyase subunit 6/NADH:ubiquinone oxidoreductase subunit I